MSYIEFDKLQLINLEYSLTKELLRSNRAGSYSSTTIIGCNTRKYHGLLITRQPGLDGDHHVLLSSVDETVIQQDVAFNLGIHRYKGGYYNPKGHKYIRDFVTEPIPKLTFRVGGVFLTKEMLFTHEEARVIIRYTLQDAHSPTTLRLRPFLAFRGRHSLSSENIFADTKYEPIRNGLKMCLYQNYSPLYMQLSKKHEYIHVPDWYHAIEYQEEMERGYEYLEDLFVPGYMEVALKKGERVYFSAGLEETDPAKLKHLFEAEVKRRIPRNTFENCLVNSAHQFIQKNGDRTEVMAGFPWFGQKTRDTLIALPGLTLFDGRTQNFLAVIDTILRERHSTFYVTHEADQVCRPETADARLWLFWSLQQHVHYHGEGKEIWKRYGSLLKDILEDYRAGHCKKVHMDEDGLIHAEEKGQPLTWMDAVVQGKPVTQRPGKAVEVNALWYNAILFSLDLAKLSRDKAFTSRWESLPGLIRQSFEACFWDEGKAYLADHVHDGKADWSLRPNQLIAASLPYSPVSEDIRKQLLDRVQSELLTPRGLRSLSPKDPNYIGVYQGNQQARDLAAHQGTVWPWLIAHFAEAYLRIHGKGGLSLLKKLYAGFEPVIREHGIGSISEVYDGDPPHAHGGAISMAWSVGEILRFKLLLDEYENKEE